MASAKRTLPFAETADVEAARADCEAPSVKDDPAVASYRVYYAICAHDFAAAEEILSENPNEEINFYGALVPRQIWALCLEFIRGSHPTIEQFGAVRERLYQKVEADPSDPYSGEVEEAARGSGLKAVDFLALCPLGTRRSLDRDELETSNWRSMLALAVNDCFDKS